MEKPMIETTDKPAISSDTKVTLLGGSVVFKGDLSGNEDLVIAGQFEGTIKVQDHSLTVGPEGKVKADIQAGRVVIHGFVNGNISVRGRIEIHKTGHVVGDLLAPGISIDDGAYFKGSIEILREEEGELKSSRAPLTAEETSA